MQVPLFVTIMPLDISISQALAGIFPCPFSGHSAESALLPRNAVYRNRATLSKHSSRRHFSLTGNKPVCPDCCLWQPDTSEQFVGQDHRDAK